MKKQSTLLLFLSALLIASCSHPNKGIQIYNPLDWAMDVTVNDKLIVIGGDDAANLPAESGTYKIQVIYQEKIIADTAIELSSSQVNKGVLLNFSGEPLYRVGQEYEVEKALIFSSGQPTFEKELAFYDSLLGVPGKHNVSFPGQKDLVFLTVDSTLIMGDIKEYPANQVLIEREWEVEPHYAFPKEIEITIRQDDMFAHKKIFKVFSKSRLLEYWYEE